MQIFGFNKTTLLDYPEHVACTLFTGGCNFRCPFCHNGGLVEGLSEQVPIPEEEIFSVLKKRRHLLSGVCVTGGEPTLHADLPEFLGKIKKLGYLVKLDTNGYRPDVLATLHREGLLDYVAMDIKSGPEGYAKAAGLPVLDLDRIRESVSYLRGCGLPYEFRTTVVKELHSREDMLSIGRWLAGSRAYFLQSYRDSDAVLRPGYSSHSRETLEEFLSLVRPFIPSAALRGVD